MNLKKIKKRSLKSKEGILKDRKNFCVHPFAKLSVKLTSNYIIICFISINTFL